MNILIKTEKIREKVKQEGGYRKLSACSGVPYEWLCKFAYNRIENPGVKYVSLLEKYFDQSEAS